MRNHRNTKRSREARERAARRALERADAKRLAAERRAEAERRALERADAKRLAAERRAEAERPALERALAAVRVLEAAPEDPAARVRAWLAVARVNDPESHASLEHAFHEAAPPGTDCPLEAALDALGSMWFALREPLRAPAELAARLIKRARRLVDFVEPPGRGALEDALVSILAAPGTLVPQKLDALDDEDGLPEDGLAAGELTAEVARCRWCLRVGASERHEEKCPARPRDEAEDWESHLTLIHSRGRSRVRYWDPDSQRMKHETVPLEHDTTEEARVAWATARSRALGDESQGDESQGDESQGDESQGDESQGDAPDWLEDVHQLAQRPGKRADLNVRPLPGEMARAEARAARWDARDQERRETQMRTNEATLEPELEDADEPPLFEAEGDAAEGDAAEGDAAEGDAAEGDAAEGDAPALCQREGCGEPAAVSKTGAPLKYCSRACGMKVADARRCERDGGTRQKKRPPRAERLKPGPNPAPRPERPKPERPKPERPKAERPKPARRVQAAATPETVMATIRAALASLPDEARPLVWRLLALEFEATG